MAHAPANGDLEQLLSEERILFCCQSRLLAAVWVRSELLRHRHEGAKQEAIQARLVGSCTTLQEAIQLCEGAPPSLLITTQLLEQGNGLELVVAAKQKLPNLRTLLFLQHDHRTLLEHAVNTHSDGIVLEGEMGSGHVIQAMRTVSNGGFYLEPRIAHELHGSRKGHNPDLTCRELEVMQHVAVGLNDREIADILFLATDTVKYHLKRVYTKLGVHNRTRAAISLVVMGLVEPPRPLLPSPG